MMIKKKNSIWNIQNQQITWLWWVVNVWVQEFQLNIIDLGKDGISVQKNILYNSWF